MCRFVSENTFQLERTIEIEKRMRKSTSLDSLLIGLLSSRVLVNTSIKLIRKRARTHFISSALYRQLRKNGVDRFSLLFTMLV